MKITNKEKKLIFGHPSADNIVLTEVIAEIWENNNIATTRYDILVKLSQTLYLEVKPQVSTFQMLVKSLYRTANLWKVR